MDSKLKQQLVQFLKEANNAGYASGDSSNWKKETDKSTTISYQSGDFRYHDNYFGGEPYGGREVVFYKDKPFWVMLYYGWVDPSIKDLAVVYKFLQDALKIGDDKLPVRGPKKYKSDDWEYTNEYEGEMERFKGEEKIYFKGREVYQAWYFGGLVDKQLD